MTDRRRFLGGAIAGITAAMTPTLGAAQDARIRERPIPRTGEKLPVVGLGNSSVFQNGDIARSRALLETLQAFGGRYVDVSDRSRDVVGGIAASLPGGDALFLGTYIQAGSEAGDQREARRHRELQDKPALDLVLTRHIDDFAARSDSFRALKQDGLARYVGVARHQQQYHEAMMRLMERGAVDFVQVNYSILEPEAEQRLLPMAQDLGVTILINRPFINGEYFSIVGDRELPGWAGEIGCDTWAKVSLKFILAHPAVNCVLTETANPRHARDNLGAGLGELPDARLRARMRETVLSFV
ncbi:MAG: aldo/keto reductase [Woeseiaceae bacterium]|nr:aldo/keto reductase [Woeseiaceae bacterium]